MAWLRLALLCGFSAQMQPQIVIARAGEQQKAGLRVGPRTVKDKVRDAIKKSNRPGQDSDTCVSNQPPIQTLP